MKKLFIFASIVFFWCCAPVSADIYVNAYYNQKSNSTTSKYVQEWIDKSVKFLQSENWSEAIRVSTIAISLDPNIEVPYINRAWAYVESGSIERAIADTNTAIELNPINGTAYNNRGYAYQLLGYVALAQKDFLTACEYKEAMGCKNMKEYATTLTQKHKLARIADLLGFIEKKSKEKQWAVVITASKEILAQDKENIFALVNRARAHAEQGDMTKALQHSLTAVQLNPNDAGVHHNRAYIYQLKGDISNAYQEYTIGCDLGLDVDCEYAEMLVGRK